MNSGGNLNLLNKCKPQITGLRHNSGWNMRSCYFKIIALLRATRFFAALRRLWRESEHFVHVPERLRWLRDADGAALKTVQTITGSDYGHRAMGRVQEFNNQVVGVRS